MINTLDYIKAIISLYRKREEKESIAVEKLQSAYDAIWEDNRLHNLWYALTDEELKLLWSVLPEEIFRDLLYYLHEVCSIVFSDDKNNRYDIIITKNWVERHYVLEANNDKLFYHYLSEVYWI